MDNSINFYQERLGMMLKAKWAKGAYMECGHLWYCLALGQPQPAKDYIHLAFSTSVQDFQAMVERLSDVESWQKNTSEGDSLYFFDPDGHQLEIHVGTMASRLATVDESPYEGWLRF